MTDLHLASDILESAVASLPDDELKDARSAALRHFRARGFPSLRDEDWKYTDLSTVVDISRRGLASTLVDGETDAELVHKVQASIDADWLVIANGVLDRELSTGLDARGVVLSPLRADAVALDFDDPLSDLNLALLRQGISLRVTEDRSAERPLGLLILDSANAGPMSTQARIDIDVDTNAATRFIEYHISAGSNEHYANTYVELDLAAGARVDYVRVQERALHHSQTARLNVRLERDSTMRHSGIDLGGKLVRNDLKIDIVGTGASALFDGLYVVADGQHVDNHTRIDHRVGPAVSEQEYRGILNGRCRAIWNGKAIVHHGADGTDAQQANHNLLLSEHAEIDAKPELEIYADEVKCAHGTTVGQLDEKALFYLRSRGLDKPRAERILTRAFAASIVTRSPINELHDLLGDKVEQRLRELAPGSGA